MSLHTCTHKKNADNPSRTTVYYKTQSRILYAFIYQRAKGTFAIIPLSVSYTEANLTTKSVSQAYTRVHTYSQNTTTTANKQKHQIHRHHLHPPHFTPSITHTSLASCSSSSSSLPPPLGLRQVRRQGRDKQPRSSPDPSPNPSLHSFRHPLVLAAPWGRGVRGGGDWRKLGEEIHSTKVERRCGSPGVGGIKGRGEREVVVVVHV